MSGGTGRVLEGAAAVLPAALGGLFSLDGAGFRLSAWGAVWATALLALALLAGLSGLSSRALSGAPRAPPWRIPGRESSRRGASRRTVASMIRSPARGSGRSNSVQGMALPVSRRVPGRVSLGRAGA